ncbi:MAG: peptide chain release factor N(5)-glutamine methyltransferase [Verrucomicrobiota bacterium]|nr:peptide chain release factor N(5)-glutamine methyltransferase [Verrucomicrobiota bacterium]
MVPRWVETALCEKGGREDAVRRHGEGEPWEYILGEITFYGTPLRVDRRALIPRVETELLVDRIVQKRPEGKIWDLCTGSGCIGISLQKALPETEVILSDLSEEALSLAKENCVLNGIETSLRLGDLFAPFQGEKTDLIVCNPPYVSRKEYVELERSVRDFEPEMALVAEEEGLLFYRRIAREAPDFLLPGGELFLEIGHGQAKDIVAIFGPPWKEQEIFFDLSGKERIFYARLS